MKIFIYSFIYYFILFRPNSLTHFKVQIHRTVGNEDINHSQKPNYNACIPTSCRTFCVACIVIGPTAFITAVISFVIKVFSHLLQYHHVSSTHIGYVSHMPICITVPITSLVAVSNSYVVRFSNKCMYAILQCLRDTDRWLYIKTYIDCIQFYQLWLLHIG